MNCDLIFYLIIVIMAGLVGYIVGDQIGYDRGRQDERRHLKRSYRIKQQEDVLEEEPHHDSADWWKKAGGGRDNKGERNDKNDSRWN